MPEFNPFSSETLAEPSVNYKWLHGNAPVHHYKDYDPPFYTLSKYEDVTAALRDTTTFSSHWGQGPRFTEPMGMLSNPPQHTYYRSLVQRAFTPGAIKALAPQLEKLAHELLDQLDPQNFDVHDDYAFPLPVIIICRLLGVPDKDIDQFKEWSDAAVESMGAEDPGPWLETLEAFGAYQLRQVHERRNAVNPPDDLVTLLVKAEKDGELLPDEQVLSVFNQLFVGGNETTTSLITNCVWRLLEKPDLWQQVIQNPALVDVAIEESLRFDPPVLGLYRTTTKAVEIRGVEIPENAKVLIHYAAANRDPEVFDNPDQFKLDRPPKKHMAFGLGVHFCLGAELARLEATTALRVLVERMPNLTLKNAGERIKPFFLWGRRRLPAGAL